jgi:hypothetical protein
MCAMIVAEAPLTTGFGGKGELIEDVDINARWHPLSHALIGAIPMTALCGLSLRRWRPEMLRGSA